MQQNPSERMRCKFNTAMDTYVPIWTQSNDNELWLRTYHD